MSKIITFDKDKKEVFTQTARKARLEMSGKDKNPPNNADGGNEYNPEIARSAVGALFDDDSGYISGYDDNDKTILASKAPTQDSDSDSDLEEDDNDQDLIIPQSTKIIYPHHKDDDDDNYFGTHVRKADRPRDREARRRSNTSEARAITRPGPGRNERPLRDRGERGDRQDTNRRPSPRDLRDFREHRDSIPIEDDYEINDFRSRYSTDLVSEAKKPQNNTTRPSGSGAKHPKSSTGGTRPRHMEEYVQERREPRPVRQETDRRPRGGGERPTQGRRPRPQQAQEERLNPVRVVILGVAIGLLVLVVVVILQINSLRANLAYSNEALRLANVRLEQAETLDPSVGENGASQTTAQNNYSEQLNDLLAALAQLGISVDSAGNIIQPPSNGNQSNAISPNNGTGENITTPSQPEYIRHIVTTGQHLTRIAQIHYGYSTQARVNLIMQANNLTSPDIFIGQELIIPPLPPGM